MRRRLLSDTRGSVAVIAAASIAMILACAALAIDLGSIFLQSRQLQGVADLAALAAARDPARAQAAAEATVAANNLRGPIHVEVIEGAYDPDPSVPPASRFRPGASPVSGVRVVVHAKADLFFGAAILGSQDLDISRTATAAQSRLAAFSLGTRLAAVDGGAANALLSGLTGSQVRLTVMDYQALASADVDLFQYVQALATHEHLQGASFDEVLDHETSTPGALNVLADVLANDGHGTQAAAMRTLASAASTAPNADLNRLLDLGPYGSQDHIAGGQEAQLRVGALQLANAILAISQGGRQVQLDLAAGVPGLAGAHAWLAIGERPANSPWLAVGRDGSVTIRTAQARLYVQADVAPVGVLPGLAQVHAPILLEAASAEARIASIDCTADQAVLEARPGIGRLALGDIDLTRLNNFQSDLVVTPATLASVAFLSVKGQADTHIGGLQWQPLAFTRADITNGVVRSVHTQDVAQASFASLLGATHLTVLGIGLGGGPLTNTVSQTLGAAAPSLDGLINGLADLLGVRLGEADLRLNGLRCRGAALVA